MGENIRIAVASSDGKTVNMHFGDASHFLIFEVEGNQVNFVELMEKEKKPLQEHSDRWMQSLDIITDCKAILCSRMGQEPASKLEEEGISPAQFSGTIVDAIKYYLKENELKRIRD